jgi:hypothetical protein
MNLLEPAWETRPNNAELPGSSIVCQQTIIASETQVSVGEPSTFPAADALSPICTSDILPIMVLVSQVETQDIYHSHHHRQKGCPYGSSQSKSSKYERGSVNDSCDSSGCHSTHQGFRPYGNSITCTRKRRRYSEKTDSEYRARASHIEELEVSEQKANSNPRIWKPGIRLSYAQRTTPTSNSSERDFPEVKFVSTKMSGRLIKIHARDMKLLFRGRSTIQKASSITRNSSI